MTEVSKLTWRDVNEIAYQLYQQKPEIDPLTIRFTDLADWTRALKGFVEVPGLEVGEKILEAVQMAWLEEWKLDQT